MTHADMAEGVDDALVGDNPVGERELAASINKSIRPMMFSFATAPALLSAGATVSGP